MGRHAKVSSILFRKDLFQAHLENWELILQERTVEAIERIASVPGVAGVILGGSVGRGMAWPISDIDLIYITTRVADNSLAKKSGRACVVHHKGVGSRHVADVC